jgi:hypothetical protein
MVEKMEDRILIGQNFPRKYLIFLFAVFVYILQTQKIRYLNWFLKWDLKMPVITQTPVKKSGTIPLKRKI